MKKQTIKKIKDSAMFGGSSFKSHWYIENINKNGEKQYRQMTHLYNPDAKRFSQLKSGVIDKHYVSTFETPQGVYKNTIINNDVKKSDVVAKRSVYIKKASK